MLLGIHLQISFLKYLNFNEQNPKFSSRQFVLLRHEKMWMLQKKSNYREPILNDLVRTKKTTYGYE